MNFLSKWNDTITKILTKIYDMLLTSAPVLFIVFLCNLFPKWPTDYSFPEIETIFMTILGVLFIDFLYYALLKSHFRKRNVFVFAGIILVIGIIAIILWIFNFTWIFISSAEFFLNRKFLFLLILYIMSSYLLQKRFPGRCLLLVMIITTLLFLGFQKVSIPIGIVVLSLFYSIDTLVQICQRRAYGKKIGARSARSLLPFILVLSCLCFFIPAKEEPYSWKKVIHAYEKFEEFKDVIIYRLYTRAEDAAGNFGVKAMGYSEDDGSLGGSVARNDIVMLDIITNKNILNRMYLAGTTYDTYEDKSWKISKRDAVDLDQDDCYQMGILMNLYALSQVNDLDLNDASIFHMLSVDLIIRNMRTKSFFIPQDCISLNVIFPDKQRITIAGNNVRSNEVIRKKQKYSAQYMEINDKSELFQKCMSQTGSLVIDEQGYQKLRSEIELWENSIIRTRLIDLMDHNSYTDLAQYAETQKKENSSLPKGTSERIIQLSKEITKDCHTDYEKICSIQSYLKSNYIYSTKMKKVEGDPVENFLFESKTGYCTYFASSFTMLCRAAGIPARYVEGISYCKNTGTGKPKSVTGKYAHAWSEVFLDGYGYLIVDATPGYETRTGIGWPINSDKDGYQPNKDWMNNANVSQYMNKHITTQISQLDPIAKKTMQKRQLRQQLLVGLILLVPILLLILIFIKLISRWNYKHSDLKKQMSYQIYEIMDRITFLQYKKKKSEPGRTVREILTDTNQIKWDQTEQVKVDLSYLCDLYDRSHYGSEEINRKDIVYMEQVNKILKKKIRAIRRAKLRIKHS